MLILEERGLRNIDTIWLRAVELEGRMLSQVEEMLSFYERGAEDCVAGRKNAEKWKKCCLLMRGGRRQCSWKEECCF
jgi:hypothetical protein